MMGIADDLAAILHRIIDGLGPLANKDSLHADVDAAAPVSPEPETHPEPDTPAPVFQPAPGPFGSESDPHASF